MEKRKLEWGKTKEKDFCSYLAKQLHPMICYLLAWKQKTGLVLSFVRLFRKNDSLCMQVFFLQKFVWKFVPAAKQLFFLSS